MRLLWYPGWLLGCCYAVARGSWSVARVLLCGLLGNLGWLLGCCYAVAREPWVVARVLLCGARVTGGGC